MATNSAINTRTPIGVTKGGTGATTLTEHSILVGSSTGAITPITAGTNGQVLLCDTGGDPAFATLTSTGSTISFTAGANTLNIEASGFAMSWSEVTGTSQSISVENAYIANNASEINFTLPATASVGDRIYIVGKGAGKYRISQGEGQKIYIDSDTCDSGYVTASAQYTSFDLLCTTADDGWTAQFIDGTYSLSSIPTSWTQRTSQFTADDVYGAACDGSTYFVIVGENGKMSTATDPTGTWAAQTSSFDTTNIYDVAYDGSTNYVAVGATGKLATATDPTGTWTQRTSSFETDLIYGVAYDGSTTWVAVGTTGTLATATDPTGTWTQRTSSFDTTHINGVAYDGASTWVAVGSAGTLATAADPTGTWTQRSGQFSGSDVEAVAYGNGVWVIVGDDGKLSTSTSPTGTWTARTSSFESSKIFGVAYGNGVWVAVSASGKVATTLDPTGTWTQRTSSFSSTNITCIAYGNEEWVAVGLDAKIATSTTSS